MIYILLFVVPLLAVLWFLNFTTFLKNLNVDKNTQTQIILGALLSFMLVFAIMYGFVGLH
ncbi:hypothetical protein J27TS8_44410 [Robertmurraya siralis]|uniref:Uncharacterized protein n=1 Tax=Robertmurraya siralis TaxID=77777 RepID=A0A919WMI2_9BACI|nr:hypothetical protein [Robertmurraya siralis]PAE22653.1 hypothetical protein CHH80_00010 [Bacillus sp. 7504-2]GIN64448.1 hypothetical protein J27TS8_44410 [Robertmurraya siralis]